jgi:poly(hydroxyalkanoate) granule-associated protein
VSKPKLKKKSAGAAAVDALKPKSLMDSAQQIWMAGLGAFARAREEGPRMFDALIKEGVALEQKTRKFATGNLDVARDAVETTVAQVRERAQDSWDKLEKVFEDRVSRSLGRLGVPGRDEMQALLDRVEDLNRALRKMAAPTAAARSTRKPRKAKARKAK